MSSIDRADPVIMGHILAEHRELHAQLVGMRACLAAPGRCVTSLRESLEHLRTHLRAHFCQEETGGYLEESIARMPRLSAAAREVVAEHPQLLAELDALLADLPVGDIREEAWQAAGRGFATFTDHLLAHERNENAVVQQGYNEDFGFGD